MYCRNTEYHRIVRFLPEMLSLGEGGQNCNRVVLGFLIVSPPDRMVASYLVHHSYCATAEAFAKSTDQAVQEELASIKNRQSEFLTLRISS